MTVSAADNVPLVVGLKTTAITHVAPAASVALDDGQLLVWVKSAASVPVKAILEIVRAAVPVLVSVTSCAALEAFKSSPLKTRLPGWKPTPDAMAVPVRATAWGLSGALSATVNDPVIAPALPGLK